jgi:hypothetical protein
VFECDQATIEAFGCSSTQENSKKILEFMHTQGCSLDQNGEKMSEYVKGVVIASAGWCVCDPPPDTVHNQHLDSMKADVSRVSWRNSPEIGSADPEGITEWQVTAASCFGKFNNIDKGSEHALVQFFCGIMDCLLLMGGFFVSG